MSVLDVRRKVSTERLAGTHERLRNDHIQMMEMLQRSQDSNAKLEDELEKLRAQLGSSSDIRRSDVDIDVEALQADVVALKNAVKQLEHENQCLTRLYDGKIEV